MSYKEPEINQWSVQRRECNLPLQLGITRTDDFRLIVTANSATLEKAFTVYPPDTSYERLQPANLQRMRTLQRTSTHES